MASDDHFKQQIISTVAKYKKMFPEEYVLVVDAIRNKRAALFDERFGEAPESGNDMRALYEIPETLNNLIVMDLDVDGLTWFSTKKASRWFALKYPEFTLPAAI